MAVIVVAEDDPDLRELVTLILGQAGHEVVGVGQGDAALAACRERRPAVAVLDIAMPGDLDGLAVTRALRADPATADLPVLLLTARARADDVRAGIDSGADDYIAKPFDVGYFVERVGRLVADGRLA